MPEQQPPKTPDLNSVVGKIMESRAREDERKAILAEEIDEYKKALNGMAGSEYGIYFFRKMIRYCGIHAVKRTDPTHMFEMGIKANVYNELVRPYLAPEIRAEIERETA